MRPVAHFGSEDCEVYHSRTLVFFDGAAPGAGKPPRAYRDDPATDLAGILQRVGEFRYRLVLPAATGGEILIVELVAAPRAKEATLAGR